jgi:hypothetical protein
MRPIVSWQSCLIGTASFVGLDRGLLYGDEAQELAVAAWACRRWALHCHASAPKTLMNKREFVRNIKTLRFAVSLSSYCVISCRNFIVILDEDLFHPADVID